MINILNIFKGKPALVAGGVVVIVLLVLVIVVSQRSVRNTKVVGEALAAMAESGTWHMKMNLDINLPEELGDFKRPLTKVKVDVEGDVKKEAGNSPELVGDFEVEAKGSGNIFFAIGGVALLSDAVAFYMDEFPLLLNPSGSLIEKWTYVEVPALETKNPDEVREALAVLAEALTYAGSEKIEGVSTRHFNGALAAEIEQRLVDVLDQQVSGNRAFNVLARLLKANDVGQLDVWVNKRTKELVQVQVSFVQPDLGFEDSASEFAKLTLTFTDYGKEVEVNRPEKELTVRSEVFGKLFGTGEVGRIE